MTAPALAALAADVEARCPTAAASPVHGVEHAKRVAIIGRELTSRTTGADRLVVDLFAILHDSQRKHDGADAEHGPRAARLARDLCAVRLEPSQLDQLIRALHDHDRGRTSHDPTIGACWDADRLNLWRVGIIPSPVLLSTPAARRPETIEAARQLQAEPLLSWAEVFDGKRSTERETVRLYHGTSAHLERVLAEEGLRTIDGVEPFVTASLHRASLYAMRAACLRLDEHPEASGRATIIQVEVPRRDLTRDIVTGDYAVTSGSVEPSRILGVVRRFNVRYLAPELRANLAANNRYDRSLNARLGTVPNPKSYDSPTVQWLRARRQAETP